MSTLTPNSGVSGSGRQSLRRRAIVIRNQAGRPVGDVRLVNGQLTFVKYVNPAAHQLQCPPAWANDRVVLDQLGAAGADALCHEDRQTGRQWWTTRSAFLEHGFRVNRGHGDQIGLALKHWRVEDPGAPSQLALFG